MVEGIEGLEAELQRCALRELHRLEQRHVPDVQSGSAYRIAACIRLCSKLRLDEARLRIDRPGILSYGRRSDDITNDIGVVFRAALPSKCGFGWVKAYNRGGSACPRVTHRVDHRTCQTCAARVDNGSVARDIAVSVGVCIGKRSHGLARLRQVRAAPLPTVN